MVKVKNIKKGKTISKGKVRLPEKVKKGQITKQEMKAVGYIALDNKLKNSAPVESISGIGVKRGEMLRKSGIKNVGDYRISFKEFAIKHRAKKIKKSKPKRKYYIIENKTGKTLSVALDSRGKAKKRQELFKSESTIIHAKPDSVERMGKNIKKKHTASKPLKPSQPQSRIEYEIDTSKRYRKLHQLPEPKPIMKGRYKITVFDKADKSGRKVSLVEIIDVKTKDKIEDWVLSSSIENKESIDEIFQDKFYVDVETTPVKSQKKGGGNDYIADIVIPEMMSKPKLSDWKNDKGKIRKSALRKHVIRIYEEEYGKDSVITEKTRDFTKDLTGKDNYLALKALSDNYPNDFASEEQVIKDLESQ